jgi:hypothetical protein
MKLKKVLKKTNLSWFDLFVLVCGVSLLLAFFLFFYRKNEVITIRVKVTDQEVLYANTQPLNWYANHFKVGDSEADALGRTITEITHVQVFPTSAKTSVVYLDLNVRATYDRKTKTYSARGRNLSFGTPLRFSLGKVTFDGIVVDFPNMNQSINQRELIVTSSAKNVEPYFSPSLHIGDKITDSNGKVFAEITSIETSPAKKVTQTSSGELLLKKDPYFVDLEIKVKVDAKVIDGVSYFFDDSPLKIGEIIPLNLNNVSLFPVISRIENL